MRFPLPLALSLAALPWSCTNEIVVDKAPNVSPGVSLREPADESEYAEFETIDFLGSIADGNGLDDIQSWALSSSLDGLLTDGDVVPDSGFVQFATALSVGTHTVTLLATDLEGEEGTDSITVVVHQQDQFPTAQIIDPQDEDTFDFGDGDISFSGAVQDPQDDPDLLLVVWTIEPTDGSEEPTVLFEGTPDGTGVTVTDWTPTGLGGWRVLLEVTDLDGNASSNDIEIEVTDPLDTDNDGDGYTLNQQDCDDNDVSVHPGALELCGNSVDDDCNGVVDDKELDHDNHVDELCAATYVGPLPADDCDDDDASVYPGNADGLDGVDNDCDGAIDELTDAWDLDGDCVCVADECTGSENPLCTTLSGLDCDDDDPNNFPGNAETCDGFDNDCDEAEDDGLPFRDYWPDADSDGYGSDAALPVPSCDGAPAQHADNRSDCDDSDGAVSPGEPEFTCDQIDNDCDPGTLDGPDGDGDGSTVCDDCDDADAANAPDGVEACDGADNDCSGVPDDGVVFQSYYPDADGDGFGDAQGAEAYACAAPPGSVPNNLDCDDASAVVSPAAAELTCDSVDNDCDPGTLDQPDVDGDGASMCTDCDDADPLNWPGGPELCDSADNNCNTVVDDGITFVDYWPDGDGDNHGDPAGPSLNDCKPPPPGYTFSNDDCDDSDPVNFPGNPEVCDDLDNDCDDDIDEGLLFVSWWPDVDGDGYGNTLAVPTTTCDGPPLGLPRVANGDDCNDSNAFVNPSEAEAICDGLDNDCLTQTDDTPDDDGDGIPVCSDCDDGDAENFPGNSEVCDGADNDCDGDEDDGLMFVQYYLDNDGDGYGTSALPPVPSCSGPPPGRVAVAGDCNDVDSAVNPGVAEATCDGVDNDCSAATLDQPDGDGDGSSMCVDCDDANPDNRPGGGEVCDGADNDCDFAADDGLTFLDFWPDFDGDGFGRDVAPTPTCDGPPQDYVSNHLDCDDAAPDNFPTNPEVCDGADNDCNGAADNGLTFTDYYPDGDHDGFGSSQVPGTPTCDGAPALGWLTDNTDCNDANGAVNPNGTELTADGIDQDCDGSDNCWLDADGDGVGVNTSVDGTTLTCDGPNESDRSDDCDDADLANFPGNVEYCDGRDNNCSGAPDENQVFVDYYPDDDGDGFGDAGAAAVPVCTGPPLGHVTDHTDCDDTRAAVNPGEPELTCNGLDDDCSAASQDEPDADLDGVSVCADCDDADPANFPGNSELCDDADNDCDTFVDDGLPFVDSWADADVDGWGDPADAVVSTCDGVPVGRVPNDLDCDDTSAALNQDDLDTDTFSTCDGDCDDLEETTFPGAVDLPDEAFVDSNCDGIDGDKATAAFVSTAGSDIANLVCSFTQPCRTLAHGQDIAVALGLPDVYVRAGTYTGGVELQDGLDLWGGYDATWSRALNTEAGHTVVLQGGFVAIDSEYITVRARSVHAGMHDLQVDGPNAVGTINGSGRSSYAIHAESSTLVIERVAVNQGNASSGVVGTTGADASQIVTQAGFAGTGGGSLEVCDSGRRSGGAGGVNTVCGTTSGGAGGASGSSDTSCSGGTCGVFGGDCTPKSGLAGVDGARANGSAGEGALGGATCKPGIAGAAGLVTNGAAGAGGTGNDGYLGGTRGVFWYGFNGTSGVSGVT
ncbi:MAG: putative metal-binding motif-containing protein, partial [Myxococcota bacterium]